VCHYGLRFKITRQVVLKVLVNCSVSTSNDASMHVIRGFILPSRWLDKLHPFHLGIAGTVRMLLKRCTP
jgi:hypothetical protein